MVDKNNLYDTDSIESLDALILPDDIEEKLCIQFKPHKKEYKARKRYLEKGWFVGSYGIRFVDNLHIKNNRTYGIFSCPLCNKNFLARLDSIDGNRIKSCGCRKHFTSQKNQKTMIEKRPPVYRTDIQNKKFGHLTPKYPLYKTDSGGNMYWYCECDCGGNREAVYNDIKSGHVTSCPSCRYLLKARQYIGQRFGKIVITEIKDNISDRSSNGGYYCHIKCDCGNEKDIPLGFIIKQNGQRSCGACSCSKGELKIKNILKEQKINFIQEKIFNDCRNPKTNSLLKFDFYLPDYNCCIEYDGEQHFKASEIGWNTKENLKETQYRDEIKNQYCKDNNIKLIRIPYMDINKINYNYLKEKGCFNE